MDCRLYTHLFSSSVMLPGIRSDGLDDNRIQKRYTRVVYISEKNGLCLYAVDVFHFHDTGIF